VGDDGSAGTATSYELRDASAAACPLTAATFSSGTAVTGLPAPSASGAAETFTVAGLTSDTAYCFMLRVTDDAGNASLSNSAGGSTRDVTAPDAAAITAGSATGTSVQVDWLAVGDDGSTGTATAYDLRYASGAACPLTPATFDAATAATGVPAPAPAGTAQSATVSGLTSDTAWCFMLQVTDDAGNTSFSNSSGTRTLDVTPPASRGPSGEAKAKTACGSMKRRISHADAIRSTPGRTRVTHRRS
jgi:chitodextrinase